MRLTLIALLTAALACAQGAEKSAAIDRIFAGFTRSTPGCAVGVSEAGRVVHASGYGLADLERQVPITAQTVFESGSVAKQFTAAAVLLLVQQGALSLDDPIGKYLPELAHHGPGLTIRRVLQHTGGLREWRLPAALSGRAEGSYVYSNEEILALAARQRGLNFEPGTNYTYSNTGFNAMPILIERLLPKGQSFTGFTQDRIFGPLEMKHTRWRSNFRDIIPQRALAYGRVKDAWTNQTPIENIYGAGGMLTTVEDLLRWNENFTHARVGGAEMVKLQQTPAVLVNGRQISNAMGLVVTSYLGQPEVAHGGATGGYRTYLARYPKQQLSIALLCNTAEVNSTELTHRVAALWIGAGEAPKTSGYTPDAAEIERLDGVYRHENSNFVTRFAYKPGGTLQAVGLREFKQGNSTIRLSTNEPVRLEISDANTVSTYYKFEVVRPGAQLLEEYVGQYESEETGSTMEFFLREGQLHYRIGQAAAYALRPTYADGFEHFQRAFFTFERGPKVQSVLVSDPRTWGIRFRRVARP